MNDIILITMLRYVLCHFGKIHKDRLLYVHYPQCMNPGHLQPSCHRCPMTPVIQLWTDTLLQFFIFWQPMQSSQYQIQNVMPIFTINNLLSYCLMVFGKLESIDILQCHNFRRNIRLTKKLISSMAYPCTSGLVEL